ncbi:MAG: 3-keto-5-aminohexanoate cleavage protein [Ignavibacteriaceae bacterium]
MLLKIALNGARPKSQNEFLPHSLDEIEREVRLIYQNGYKVFHIHCYDKNGNESLKPEDVNNLVLRVKSISSDIQLGISSGDWIEPDLNKRIGYINQWEHIPDFASVNMIEDNAIEISNVLISKGVMVEAGLNEKKAAEIFVNSRFENGCIRILIEPEEENLIGAIKTITEIENILNDNNITIKRLLHGFNSAAWDILREAKKRGYDSRIGMEDTIFLEDGIKVKNNLDLINYAGKILSSVEINNTV